MSDWPRGLDVAPIGEWPGTLTPSDQQKASPFVSTQRRTDREGRQSWQRREVSLTDTLALLDRELTALRAEEIALLIAIPRDQFRLDGRPRADAKPAHPGVILSFTTKVGHLSYPCDTFTTWQGNLRAIALALEALRKVDRYGVTPHGEQYRGFLAIEASAGAASTSADEAEAWIRRYAEVGPLLSIDRALTRAKRLAHPDMNGGSVEQFVEVQRMERVLRDGGRL